MRSFGLHDELYGPALADALVRLGPLTGWRCADIGSGTGAVAAVLAGEVGPSGTVFAVDQDPDAAEEAASHGAPLVAVTMAAEELRLPEKVRLCCCRFLLVNVDEPVRVVMQMARSVCEGGYVLLEEPVTSLGAVGGDPLSMPGAPHPDAGDLLEALAAEAGLAVLSSSRFTPFPHPEVAAEYLGELTGVHPRDQPVRLPPLVTVLAQRRSHP